MRATRALLSPLVSLVSLVSWPAGPATAAFFPYEVHKRTLPNGLDVLVVETPEFRDVVNLNVLILAGSRNEVEKGRSGLAHLFEHIAFRHKFEDPTSSYRARMEKLGAFDNAWTWFDVTYYHPVTFARDLEELVEVQAERFVALDFSERIYRTEAGAVLGEYRRIASDPGLRMDEVLSDLAFGEQHGYGHTTMGYLADIETMPETFEAGRRFYETYYRPNNAVVIVTGDVRAAEVFPIVERRFGSWERREVPELPDPEPLDGPKRGHVDWPTQVAPRVLYAHRVTEFRPGEKESAVLTIIPELIAGPTAPLYRKLRYETRIATDMSTDRRSSQGFDARMLETTVRIDRDRFEKEGASVIEQAIDSLDEGLGELRRFSQRDDAAATLDAVKAKLRYDLLATLDSPQDIAGTLAWYYRFDRDPRVLDRLVGSVEELRPEDVDAFAAKHFVPESRVVVTMTPAPEGETPADPPGR